MIFRTVVCFFFFFDSLVSIRIVKAVDVKCNWSEGFILCVQWPWVGHEQTLNDQFIPGSIWLEFHECFRVVVVVRLQAVELHFSTTGSSSCSLLFAHTGICMAGL